MPGNVGQYKIEIVADDSKARKNISEFEDAMTDSQFRTRKAAEQTQKYMQNQQIKTVKEEKAGYRKLTKALQEEHSKRLKDAKGHLGKERSEHQRHLKLMEKAEKEHAQRVEQLRKKSAKGRAVGKLKGLGSAASEGMKGGGAIGAVTGVIGKLGPYGMAAAAAIGTVSAALSAGAKAAKEFNDGALKIKTLLSETQAQALPEAMAQLRQIAMDTGASLTEDLQPALYNIISATPSMGDNMAAAAAMAGKAAETGIALGASTNDVAAATSNLANAMGLSLESIENQDFILDTLANTMKQGVIPSGQALASNIAKVAPAMNALAENAQHGVKALGAMTAALTANGVSVDEAQTQMKALVGELLSADKAQKVAALGLRGFDAETKKITNWSTFMQDASKNMGDLMGIMSSSEAQNAVRILAKEGGKGFADLMASMDNAGGTAQQMAAVMADSGEVASKRLDAAMNDVLISVGEGTSGLITNVKSIAADALSGLATLFKSNQAEYEEAAAKANELYEQTKALTDTAVDAQQALIDLATGATKEVPDSTVQQLRNQANALKDTMPDVAARITETLNQPGGLTVESLGQINVQLAEAAERSKLFALAASDEATAESYDALNDTLDELGGGIDNVTAGALYLLGPLGQAAAIFGVIDRESSDAFTNQNQIIEETQAQLEELNAAMKEAQDAGDLEEMNSLRKEIVAVTREQENAEINVVKAQQALKKQIEAQVAEEQKRAELLGKEFDKAEALRRVGEELAEERGNESDTAGEIRYMISDMVMAEESRLEKAKEITAAKEEEFALGEETLGVVDEMTKQAEALGVTTKDANADKLTALKAEEIKQQQLLAAMRAQLAALKAAISGEQSRADALEEVKKQELQIQKIKKGETVEVTSAKKVETGDLDKAASQMESKIAELEKLSQATTAKRVELEESMAKKAAESQKKRSDAKGKALKKRERSRDRGSKKRSRDKEKSTRKTEQMQDRGQKKRISKEEQAYKKRVADMDKRLEQRAKQLAEWDKKIKQMREEAADEIDKKTLETTERLKGLGSTVLFSLFDKEIAEVIRPLTKTQWDLQLKGLRNAVALQINAGLSQVKPEDLKKQFAALTQDLDKMFKSAKGTLTFDIGGGKTASDLATLKQAFEGLIENQQRTAKGTMSRININERLLRLMAEISNVAIEHGLTEERIKRTKMDILNAEARMLEHRKAMGEFERDHEQYRQGDLDYLAEKIELQEKIVAEKRREAGISGDLSQTLVAEARALEEKRRRLAEIEELLKKQGYQRALNIKQQQELFKANAAEESGVKDTLKTLDTRRSELQKHQKDMFKLEKALDSGADSLIAKAMKEIGLRGDAKAQMEGMYKVEKQLKSSIAVLDRDLEVATVRRQEMQTTANNLIAAQKEKLQKMAPLLEEQKQLMADIETSSASQTKDGKAQVGINQELLKSEEELHALKKQRTLIVEDEVRALRNNLRGMQFEYDSIQEKLDAQTETHQKNLQLLHEKTRALEAQKAANIEAFNQVTKELKANEGDAKLLAEKKRLQKEIGKNYESIAEMRTLMNKQETDHQRKMMALEKERADNFIAGMNEALDVMNSMKDASFGIYDAITKDTEESAIAGIQAFGGLMGKIHPAFEVVAGAFDMAVGIFKGVRERVEERRKEEDEELAAQRRRLAIQAVQLRQITDQLDIAKQRLEIEEKINATYVGRNDEARENIVTQGEMIDNTMAIFRLSNEFLQQMEDIDLLFDGIDVMRLKQGLFAAREGVRPTKEALDDILFSIDKMQKEVQVIVDAGGGDNYKTANEQLTRMIEQYELMLQLVKEQAENERAIRNEQKIALEHEKAMGRFQGDERDFLEDKLRIQDELFRLAEQQLADELITLQEFRSIELERYEIEQQLLALKESEGELDQDALNRLREMNMERQKLVLGGGDPAKIRELEEQIIEEMRRAGSSEDAIRAATEGFAAASYAVGTPYIEQDQVAQVHKGERIFTKTENEALLALMRSWSSSMAKISAVGAGYMASKEAVGGLANTTTNSQILNVEAINVYLESSGDARDDGEAAADAALLRLQNAGIWNNR